MLFFGHIYVGPGAIAICFMWSMVLLFLSTKGVVRKEFKIRDAVFAVFTLGVTGSALTILVSVIFLAFGDPSRMHLVQETPLLRLQLPELESETYLIRERITEKDKYRFIEQDANPDGFTEIHTGRLRIEVHEEEGLAPVMQTWMLRVVCEPTDWLHEYFGSCHGRSEIIIFQIPEGGLWEKTQIATSSPS